MNIHKARVGDTSYLDHVRGSFSRISLENLEIIESQFGGDDEDMTR